jgi:hypothetical protein
MALVFLPWLAVVLFTAGPWAALIFLGYAIVVAAAGYGIVSLALPASTRTQVIVLAPAVGVVAVSALTAFWLRLGLSITWVPALWLGLMAAGAIALWKDRILWAKTTIAYGGALVVLSTLICAIYFLPGARNDAVQRRDGSFNWIYVDTQYNESIAADIAGGDTPPKRPGTATAELYYHFGPYAPSAAVSRISGLALGDAYARVTRGASLWALVLSCFGLGTLLSLKATGEKFGGIVSVAGLFFYGSLLSLFTEETSTSSYVTGAILFKIPNVQVLGNGGPFSHLILGHSVLHGLGAITAIMGLCLVQREQETALTARGLVLLALPALAVPMHLVAAMYCVGVASILLFWGRLASVRPWLSILLMCCLFLGAWVIMGYNRSSDAAQTTINHNPGWYWWTLVVWFTVGLGFRIMGFRWISNPLKDPLSLLVIASVLGLLAFNLLLKFEHGEERYGIYFLQSIFSVLAFSRVTSRFWQRDEREKWTAEWLSVAKKGMIFFVAAAVLLRIALYAVHSDAWIASVRRQIVPCILLALLLAGASALMKRSPRFSTVGSAVLMGALAVGFLGWISPWLNFGMGRMKMDVTVSPGEVQGLKRLGELAAPDERFATNKHEVESLRTLRDRSYAYGTLSERPVLLEGYEYKSVTALRGLRPCSRRTTSSLAPRTQRQCTISPRHGTSVGLSPVPAPTFPCPAHCLRGWSRSQTAATLRFTGSTNPPQFP